MRLGKIECGAKALACGLACTSFNFAKRWHCVFHFRTVVYCLHCRHRVACNEEGIKEVKKRRD